MGTNSTGTAEPIFIAEGKSLLQHHFAHLAASGITLSTIKAAGIHSVTNGDTARALLNKRRAPTRNLPAIVFPFVDAEGRNGYCRLRPDNPRKVNGKVAKYESPVGEPNRAYLPPGVAAKLSDANIELLLTEGEKKALKASQEGFPCVGLVGVYGWKSKGEERLSPELERINWQGRKVFIAFDSDASTKDDVLAAESRLAKCVADRGGIPRVVRLPGGPLDAEGKPGKVGLDDFIVAQGLGALRKLLDEASEPGEVDGGESKQKASTLDPARAAGEYLADAHGHHDGRKLQFWRGTFFRWVAGGYRELTAQDIRCDLICNLNDKCSDLGMSETSNILDQVKAQSALVSYVEPPSWLGAAPRSWLPEDVLPTKSAIVHLPSFVLGSADCSLPATPRYFTTAALDCEFQPDAPAPVEWLKFLSTVWPDDPQAIAMLQEWFGYCLTPDTRQQKMLVVVGPKRSGKGTIARVLGKLVGEANRAGPTLASLSTNFGLWPLLGKLVAIVSDARLSGRVDQAQVVERLLSITGEDPITVDRKHLAPVTAKIPARLVILTNELPSLSDSSGALAGRMLMLRMKQSFYGREDHDLTARLLGELPGILTWAAQGWERLRKQGRFVQPDSARELVDTMADLASPVAMFVRERCFVSPACRVRTSDLFAAWQEWCVANGRQPGSNALFGRNLNAAFESVQVVQPREDGERYRAYEGIGLKLEGQF